MRDDEQGINWPNIPNKNLESAFWCHGATGIGQFFLHASKVKIVNDSYELALRAALTVSSTLAIGPTFCHGLAGNIEFLLDVYQTSHDINWLFLAFRLAHMLNAFAITQHGHHFFSSESPKIFTPDYMVGYAGLIPCFLRLSQPDNLPSILNFAAIKKWIINNSPYAQSIAQEVLRDRSSDKLDCRALR